MNDAFMAETGLAMRVGVEPEVIWVRRRPDGALQPVAHTISFYDASAMLDFEPVLLDLVDVCDGLGIEVTEASSEGATQLEATIARAIRSRRPTRSRCSASRAGRSPAGAG